MKKYIVEVRSHVSADLEVEANNKIEAYDKAYTQMDESLLRQIKNAKRPKEISNLDGYVEIIKTSIRLKK